MPCHVDPDRLAASFKPEQWLDNGTRPQHVYAFSFGPHSCIGQTFAMVEIKSVSALMQTLFLSEF